MLNCPQGRRRADLRIRGDILNFNSTTVGSREHASQVPILHAGPDYAFSVRCRSFFSLYSLRCVSGDTSIRQIQEPADGLGLVGAAGVLSSLCFLGVGRAALALSSWPRPGQCASPPASCHHTPKGRRKHERQNLWNGIGSLKHQGIRLTPLSESAVQPWPLMRPYHLGALFAQCCEEMWLSLRLEWVPFRTCGELALVEYRVVAQAAQSMRYQGLQSLNFLFCGLQATNVGLVFSGGGVQCSSSLCHTRVDMCQVDVDSAEVFARLSTCGACCRRCA